MKKNIIYITSFLAISFISYCFFPFINYNTDKDPWRIYVKDRNGIVITDKANKYWYKKDINIDFKSQFVIDLLKIEDKNYYSHFWVDLYSKLWAIRSNIINWKIISWWSTITEQYIKNKYFKNNKRSYLQKSREAFLAIIFSIFKMESLEYNGVKLKNKEIILANYLNNVYVWNNIYWIWAAIEIYFWKKDLNNLSPEEISLIISLINNPWIKSLDEIAFNQYFNKIQKKLWYTFDKTIYKLNKKENIDLFPFVTNNINKLNIKNQDNSNMVTIDSKLQQYAKNILNKTLDELKTKNVTNWAIFAIDPKTREVLIYQWSRDFNSNSIDWQVDVIQSLRQPGSTMKPFLYLMALIQWANPDDLLLDLSNQYNSFLDWKTYITNNYFFKEYWLIRFKKALWNSLNNASVRLAYELWLNNVYSFYKKYWFKLDKSSDYYWYSLVLWNPSIKLEDLVWSYSNLLPNFNSQSFSSLSHLKNIDYNEEKAKFLLYDILSDPDNRDLSFWVNSILNTSIPQAVKTWTSTDFRDNLIVSYHPDFIIWIWIGNNDNSSMIWVTWITWAWYIWRNIVEKAIELWYINDIKIKIPDWIVEDEYCLDERCFRKKIIYKKEGVDYFSRILNNKYSSKDLYEKLNNDEIDRLKDFQIYLD